MPGSKMPICVIRIEEFAILPRLRAGIRSKVPDKVCFCRAGLNGAAAKVSSLSQDWCGVFADQQRTQSSRIAKDLVIRKHLNTTTFLMVGN